MNEIEFIYNQRRIIIPCNINDKLKNIVQKFSIKVEKNIEDIYCLFNGKIVNMELSLNQICNSEDYIKNKILFLVNDINKDDNKTDKNMYLRKSKNIICPICQENTRIDINNYKIKFYGCKNGHTVISKYSNAQ